MRSSYLVISYRHVFKTHARKRISWMYLSSEEFQRIFFNIFTHVLYNFLMRRWDYNVIMKKKLMAWLLSAGFSLSIREIKKREKKKIKNKIDGSWLCRPYPLPRKTAEAPRHCVSEKEVWDQCQIDGRFLKMPQEFIGKKHLLKLRVIKMVCFMEGFIKEKTSEKC